MAVGTEGSRFVSVSGGMGVKDGASVATDVNVRLGEGEKVNVRLGVRLGVWLAVTVKVSEGV